MSTGRGCRFSPWGAAETAGGDPDDIWEDFVDELEYAQDRADDIGNYTEIDMTVYVDGKGDIRGRTVVINDYIKLEYAAPEDGSKYGIRLAVSQDDYEQFVFEGDGKNKEGSFEMAVEGLHILDVSATDFDRDDLKNGYLNGSFDISLSSFVSNQLGSELDIGGLRGLDLRDIHLLLDSSASIGRRTDSDRGWCSHRRLPCCHVSLSWCHWCIRCCSVAVCVGR